MPKRFENPIEVPTAVLDGLETVQESGETHMQDSAKVQAIAANLGYPEVVAWIDEHPHEYQEGIFRGFVAAVWPQEEELWSEFDHPYEPNP